MTKVQFKEKYCKFSGISSEEFEKHFTIKKCDCGYEFCKGWAVTSKELSEWREKYARNKHGRT